MISLSPAGVEDEAFLFELFVSVRLAEYAGSGWSQSEMQTLMWVEFRTQQATYANQSGVRHDIVKEGDVPVGRILTSESALAVQLVDVSLIKPYRGRGIGSVLVRGLQKLVAPTGKPIRLQVELYNPAMRFYQRLGFQPYREHFPYLSMEWSPNSGKVAAATTTLA
ncbi:GNAT family N-acetyltransferase [Paenibacillus antri]|uniref:GNAT family N-acetyltransferase n=1 Tax=Paenibacillus antri TaxID=2582848 RepID=A0A5R9GGC1_9BACL|nr:GNAT family N-acetyltransferase [Paenibacillus antri]TLS51763.1 GNAT family N-acetyltransferase [Paenibacillus antri]